MTRRVLLLLLLIAAPAFAQTTTTTLAPPNCIDSSAADFLAATAGDIDFQTTILLVGKRHFDVSVPQNVVLCTQGANSIYYASYPNLRSEGEPALVSYMPNVPDDQRTKVTYKKGTRTVVIASPTERWYLGLGPDGTPYKLKLRDAAGHLMHPPLTAPAAAQSRRHL